MSTPDKKTLEFSLLNMFTKRHEFLMPKEVVDGPDTIDYNIDPRIGFNVKASFVFVTVIITAYVKATKEKIMVIETVFTFSINDLQYFLEKDADENSNWKFKDKKDEAILITFISIAYSTMRGIILERSRGTILEKHFLPLVDPKIFIKQK